MTTYPPAPLLWQNKLALDFTHSQIAYVGYEGTIFHISGPLAPVLGAQTGAVLKQIAHIDPPFKHLDNQGARQDGATWYDTIYEPGMIDMTITLGGMSANDMRSLIRAWLGAWSPKQLGKLCWFSPDWGEWYLPVRQAKPIPDVFHRDWYESQEVTFTWSARADNAFWQGVDSVCNISNNGTGTNTTGILDQFTYTDPTGLNSLDWTVSNTGPGLMATPTGDDLFWLPFGSTTGTEIAQWNLTITNTDDQFISATFEDAMPAGVNAQQTITVSGASGGTFTVTYGGVTSIPIGWNTTPGLVQFALQAMSSIGNNTGLGTSNATVSGPTGGPWVVTFTGALASQTIATMTTNGSGLTGSSPSVTCNTTTQGWGGFVDLWGRMNTYVGALGLYGVRLRIGYGTLLLSIFNNGTEHDVYTNAFTGPNAGDVISLQCGTTNPLQVTLEQLFLLSNWIPNQYQAYQNGNPLIPGGLIGGIESFFGLNFGFTDTNNYAQLGHGYRGVGMGMSAQATGRSQGSVTHDANASVTPFSGSPVSPVTLTWNHTCGASSDFLIVRLGFLASWNTNVTVTYNNIPLTLITTGQMPDYLGNYAFTQVWYLFNPPTGSAHSVQVVLSAFLGLIYIAAAESDSYIGVGSIGPAATSIGSDSNPTMTIPSASANYLVQAFTVMSGASAETLSNYNQTSLYNSGTITETGYLGGNSFGAFVAGDAPGAGFVTFNATASYTTIEIWSGVAVNLLPTTPQAPIATISQFSAGSGTGELDLTNIGDQPGWPRYLCYGPGTFLIPDVQTGNMISFGPLLPGQIAQLNTLPRLPAVVDLTPNTVTTQATQNGLQTLLAELINFVTANNVPPLLQQFESLFGIAPPQGPLYSLLSGRFTTAMNPMLIQTGPVTTKLPIQIQGGNDQSKVIAALTPMRVWPE